MIRPPFIHRALSVPHPAPPALWNLPRDDAEREREKEPIKQSSQVAPPLKIRSAARQHTDFLLEVESCCCSAPSASFSSRKLELSRVGSRCTSSPRAAWTDFCCVFFPSSYSYRLQWGGHHWSKPRPLLQSVLTLHSTAAAAGASQRCDIPSRIIPVLGTTMGGRGQGTE